MQFPCASGACHRPAMTPGKILKPEVLPTSPIISIIERAGL
jgi:hypothetical protein